MVTQLLLKLTQYVDIILFHFLKLIESLHILSFSNCLEITALNYLSLC